MAKDNTKVKKQELKGSVQSYPAGDFVIRLKNAAMANRKNVSVLKSKYVLNIANALKRIGYLDEVKEENGVLNVKLAFKDKRPKIMNIKLVSVPGLRIYETVLELESKKGPSTYLISTQKGILSLREALKQRSGGEVILEIW